MDDEVPAPAPDAALGQTIKAVIAGSSALVPLTVLPGQHHPGAAEVITGGFAGTFTAAVTLWWLTRRPTRRQPLWIWGISRTMERMLFAPRRIPSPAC
ncbi:hypothetical protein [Mycobacterium paraense]|uniref:hypothetical protein n=1 Tax=Mycobacterium paraense TaxID=767916 RepID=UPI001F4E9252|nr:hypothetical protein [Mycobacterium paraense]